MALLVVLGGLSELQAESIQEEQKRIECDSICDAEYNETVASCEKENEAKGLGQDVLERLCNDAGRAAKEQCISDCTSE